MTVVGDSLPNVPKRFVENAEPYGGKVNTVVSNYICRGGCLHPPGNIICIRVDEGIDPYKINQPHLYLIFQISSTAFSTCDSLLKNPNEARTAPVFSVPSALCASGAQW